MRFAVRQTFRRLPLAFVALTLLAMDLETALECERFGVHRCCLTQDAREGLRAFVEQREPVLQGR